ncbi:MAG: energy transducer TonB [Prevotella sp.]|nr:energy transducer TonB [Prevotella sp.]
MAKIDLTSNDWTDLVFANKNKEYGAYQLRRGTGSRNFWSIIIMGIAAAVLFGGFALVKTIQANASKVSGEATTSVIDQNTEEEVEVEKEEEIVYEQPKEEVEQVASSEKFTEPVIKKDDQVREDNTLRQQEDLSQSETAIGALDVKGNNEDADVLHIKEEVKKEEPKVEEKPKEEENKIFEFVEQQASFPGGPAAMNQWLNQNIRYPAAAQENNIQGRVTVQFVVELNGSISNVVVVRGVDPNLDKEAVRVVKAMPKWTPGMQNGRAVRSKFTLPVNFKLQN